MSSFVTLHSLWFLNYPRSALNIQNILYFCFLWSTSVIMIHKPGSLSATLHTGWPWSGNFLAQISLIKQPFFQSVRVSLDYFLELFRLRKLHLLLFSDSKEHELLTVLQIAHHHWQRQTSRHVIHQQKCIWHLQGIKEENEVWDHSRGESREEEKYNTVRRRRICVEILWLHNISVHMLAFYGQE